MSCLDPPMYILSMSFSMYILSISLSLYILSMSLSIYVLSMSLLCISCLWPFLCKHVPSLSLRSDINLLPFSRGQKQRESHDNRFVKSSRRLSSDSCFQNFDLNFKNSYKRLIFITKYLVKIQGYMFLFNTGMDWFFVCLYTEWVKNKRIFFIVNAKVRLLLNRILLFYKIKLFSNQYMPISVKESLFISNIFFSFTSCMFKKSCPILHSNLQPNMGQDFLDTL